MKLSDVAAAVATKLQAQSGTEWTYISGNTSESITFYKSENQPIIATDSNGSVIEIIVATFRGLTTDLETFGKPKNGDKITNGTDTFKVLPIQDKCYYTIGGMIHIHAQQMS